MEQNQQSPVGRDKATESKLVDLEKRVNDKISELERKQAEFEVERAEFAAEKQRLQDAAAVAGISLVEEDVQAPSDPARFDLRTHIRGDKRGKVTSLQLYSLFCFKGADGNTTKVFERPPGSENFFYENNEVAPKPPTYHKRRQKAPARRIA